MGIKFPPKVLRLLEIRTIVKKEDGRVFHFARLADEATFESNDFMLPNEVDPTSLKSHERYNVELDIDGRFTRIALTPTSEAINLNLKRPQP